jgi:hypothetical protein
MLNSVLNNNHTQIPFQSARVDPSEQFQDKALLVITFYL